MNVITAFCLERGQFRMIDSEDIQRAVKVDRDELLSIF